MDAATTTSSPPPARPTLEQRVGTLELEVRTLKRLVGVSVAQLAAVLFKLFFGG